jgi:predicted nucleic acid-binding protein
VDASNLACMEMRGIRKIATFDKDFLGRREVEVVNG